MIKNKTPCQAVSNKLGIYDFPDDLKHIRRLGRVLISRRLHFKKINIMLKGQFPKMKGAICNVPVDTVDISNTLPRQADSNGLIIVKLKRKMEYRGHVYFETVRPDIINRLLQYLKINNPLYNDIDIDLSQIPVDLTDMIDPEQPIIIENIDSKINFLRGVNINDLIPIEIDNFDNSTIDFAIKNSHVSYGDSELNEENIENNENPLDQHRSAASETVLIANSQTEDEFVTMAPGEEMIPLSILNDSNCEELAHPHLFPTGKFSYQDKRDITLSPVKYFNQRFLNYTQKFASDSDYIFFAHCYTKNIS